MTRTAQNQGEVIFDLPRPPTSGTAMLQQPQPRVRRAGLVPGVDRGGGVVTSKIEPCFTWTDSRSLMLAFRTESPSPISSKIVILA